MDKKDSQSRRPGGPIAVPWVSSGLLSLAVLSWIIGAGDWLEYDLGAIGQGEYWRLVTGHFTHLTMDHLFWDGLMFLFLGIYLESRNRRAFIGCVVVSGLLIGVSLPLLRPDMMIYRGLSGIDTALFVLLAMGLMLKATRANQSTVLMLTQTGLAAGGSKIAFEYLTGQTLFAGGGLTPVPVAHLVGALVGGVIAMYQSAVGPFAGRPVSRSGSRPDSTAPYATTKQ